MVTTILIQFFFSKNKISLKLKKYKKEKKKLLHRAVKKKHILGVRLFCCVHSSFV